MNVKFGETLEVYLRVRKLALPASNKYDSMRLAQRLEKRSRRSLVGFLSRRVLAASLDCSTKRIGAVVLRFMEAANAGNYQIVRCGRRRKRSNLLLRLAPLTARPSDEVEPARDIDQDVCNFASIHDIQPETKKCFKKEYQLVNENSENLLLKE